MVVLVGVAGFAGAGKTTAVEHFAELARGRVVYFGDAVLEELRVRGLDATRENEREIRIELRNMEGPAVLAKRCAHKVAECVADGMPVFVDAIFSHAEFDFLKSSFPGTSAHLLAIRTSFDVRLERLERRAERPYCRQELEKRDRTELEELGIDTIMSAANQTVRNEESREHFYQELATFLQSCH